MATVSKQISLKTSDCSLGRYWIANETIPSGTLLIQESPIASIPNCQIIENNVSDPIDNKKNSLCWNCCSLFPSNKSNTNHYCTQQCKTQSNKIMDIIFNPSLSFNKSIQNDSTLRLTLFMTLKMINYCIENKKQSLLSNIDETFNEFDKTPSKFYDIFSINNNNNNNNKESLLLQYKINNTDSNELYGSYLNKLSEIIPDLIQFLNDTNNDNIAGLDLERINLLKLSINFLNIIFVNGFGIRYSLVHDDDMLGLCLFENSSFFNHSCSPNAFYHFMNGNQIIIRTLREISKNEAITISIVDDLESHSKQQRQTMILQHFGFNCLCSRCLDEEYVNNDQLLTQRMNETDCILNNKQHINLLNYARSNWNKSSPINSWKFYKRLFNEYQYHYHPFDPDILSLLQEISQKAFIMKDYQTGYDSAELGKEFCERLTSSNIIDNCHLTEFTFIFLSFANYLYLIKDKFPNKQIHEIMKLNINTMQKQNKLQDVINNDQDMNTEEIITINDDILAKMFQNEQIEINDEEDAVDLDVDVNTTKIDVLQYTPPINMEKMKELEEKTEINMNVQSKLKGNNNNNNNKNKNNNNNKKKKSKNKNKNNRNNDKKQRQKMSHLKGKKSGGKQKGNKNKHKNEGKNNNKNRNNNNNKKKSKDRNVEIYRFGDSGYNERIFELKDDEEDEEMSLELELNEKIIELYATRSILFPKFKDFEDWIGKDLLMLDSRIENVVTSLKHKFAENV